MIDIHPAHHAASTWRDFFIHIATIVIGLLIAIGLEQSVELVHRHHQAREARENIRQEIAANIDITQDDIQQFRLLRMRLGKDLDLLNGSAPDAQTLAELNYQSAFTRRREAAWNAAKVDGSLALIPSTEIADATYFYGSAEAVDPATVALFNTMDTAQALIDHAKTAGKLTAFDRQQLLLLTASGMGDTLFLAKLFTFETEALKKGGL